MNKVDFKKFKIVEAKHIFLWFLEKMGMVGWTSFWGVIYLHPKCMDNRRLIRHEQCHAMQLQRDGKFIMMIKYGYYWVRLGYKEIPYEVEAREAEDDEFFDMDEGEQ